MTEQQKYKDTLLHDLKLYAIIMCQNTHFGTVSSEVLILKHQKRFTAYRVKADLATATDVGLQMFIIQYIMTINWKQVGGCGCVVSFADWGEKVSIFAALLELNVDGVGPS